MTEVASNHRINDRTPEGFGQRPVIVANCSGFYGDRLAAAREMVEGGPIDVLTGDWLAELTMLILARQRMKNGPGSGYARTFVTALKPILQTCIDRQIRIVSNAGGLDPAGCAAATRALVDELGIDGVRIAYVTGDDLMPEMETLAAAGEPFTNLDTGEALADLGWAPLTANAYIGARSTTAALEAGAHIVITGRVTDAALAIGPAAWWHGWSYDDAHAGDESALDALAGALVAGHVIECGAQATGGNYSFFTEIDGLEHPGFPIAEIAANGDSTITKHPGTGGAVTVGTVTSQLLYEIGSPEYYNPDVTADFGTITLDQVGPDRVGISGVRGIPAPRRLKVCINTLGGFRNTVSLVLTGMQAEEKADLALRTITGLTLADVRAIAHDPVALAQQSRLPVRELDVQLLDERLSNPRTLSAAQAYLRLTVKDSDPKKVGRAFTGPIIESALATYPGMFPTAPPAEGTPYGVYWPTTIDPDHISVSVHLDGSDPFTVASGGNPDPAAPSPSPRTPGHSLNATDSERPSDLAGPAAIAPLGTVVGARSGDKGGSANVGFWVPGDDDSARLRYQWFARWITPQRLRELLPEAQNLDIDIYRLPNLQAVNVVIHGLLGRGVNESTRLDPQAKGLAEQLRARHIRIPAALVPESALPLTVGLA